MHSKQLKHALIESESSPCSKLNVGCVVFDPKSNSIIGSGYNQSLSKCCEDENGNTKEDVLHAEMVAIDSIAKSNNSTIGTILYCTHAPCVRCATRIINCGIIEVYYLNDFKNDEGVRLLKENNVITRKISI